VLGSPWKGGFAGLVVSGALLAGASSASATPLTFVVNSTGNGSDTALDGTCSAAGSVCTLRAAMEEAQHHAGADEIDFFSAMNGLTISVSGTGLPDITQPVTIDGCSAQPASVATCVGIDSALAGGGNGFTISSGPADVTIEGMAITGFDQGIFYGDGSTNLNLQGNLFGQGIGGAIDGNVVGVELVGDSATIGGDQPTDKNVFASNDIGIDVFGGADGNTIEGNLLGVKSDGVTEASQVTGIAIHGNGTDTPTNTTIGGTGTVGACAVACNIIVGSTTGIDLSDATQDAGSTTIAGNYIGLSSNDAFSPTFTLMPNVTGIDVGGADDISVGPTAGQANFIEGGSTGISAGAGAEDLVVDHNFFGTALDGASVLSVSTRSADLASSATAPLEFANNVVADGGVAGVIAAGTGGTIKDNSFGIGAGNQDLSDGGGTPIDVAGAHGYSLLRNEIGNSLGPGIYLEGSTQTVIQGNYIGTDSLGVNDHGNGQGILITDTGFAPNVTHSTLNQVGGDALQGEQNLISNNDGAAIEIAGDGNDENLIETNVGSANTGAFIDLAPNFGTTTFPNEDAPTPVIIAASNVAVAGLAPAGSAIRTYVKSTAAAGRLDAFAGADTTDAHGLYSVAGFVPIGQFAGVTEAGGTNNLNTSELATSPAVVDANGDTFPPSATVDPVASPTADATPRFTFQSSETGTFVCRIDGANWAQCASPLTTAPLSDGDHLLHVVAIDSFGNISAEATAGVSVDTTKPATRITKGPKGSTKDRTPAFGFSSTEAGSKFKCAVVKKKSAKARFKKCTSPDTLKKLKPGKYTFEVFAIDAAKNRDATPAKRKFTVKK
jgi:parallel beta-helix repeat protein